jgi:hypothetical protein
MKNLYNSEEFVDRLKLHKRCCCAVLWVRWQNCIFFSLLQVHNKHSSLSPQVVIFSRFVFHVCRDFFFFWRVKKTFWIELFIDNWIATLVCMYRVYGVSEGICITISKVSYHKFYGIEMCSELKKMWTSEHTEIPPGMGGNCTLERHFNLWIFKSFIDAKFPFSHYQGGRRETATGLIVLQKLLM